MTIDQIVREAKKLGISYGYYVANYIQPVEKGEEIPKSASGTYATKYICEVCGKPFYSFYKNAKYCSHCREYAYARNEYARKKAKYANRNL